MRRTVANPLVSSGAYGGPMAVCTPCREPHSAVQCEDAGAGRTGVARRCVCQHRTRGPVLPTTDVAPGPECEVPRAMRPRAPGAR